MRVPPPKKGGKATFVPPDAAKPLKVDRERWTTSKNVGKHYQILEQTFVDLGFAVKNPSYSADEPLSESIKFHPWALGRIVSFDESRFQLDMTDGDKNTRTTIAMELSKKGQTHAAKAGGSATVVGGSLNLESPTPRPKKLKVSKRRPSTAKHILLRNDSKDTLQQKEPRNSPLAPSHVPGEKSSPLKIRGIFGKILPSQNEKLSDVSERVEYELNDNT